MSAVAAAAGGAAAGAAASRRAAAAAASCVSANSTDSSFLHALSMAEEVYITKRTYDLEKEKIRVLESHWEERLVSERGFFGHVIERKRQIFVEEWISLPRFLQKNFDEKNREVLSVVLDWHSAEVRVMWVEKKP